MKKLTIAIATAMSLLAAPALANYKVTVNGKTQTFATKDKAYWTAVWYSKRGKSFKRSKKALSVRPARTKRASFRSSGRVLAKVDLSQQTMTVMQGGRVKYRWKVSTGRKGYRTPTGTWRIHRMHKEYYSRKYDGAPMPYAMFYHRGFAVHGTGAIGRLGRPASHGCVRLHPSNAAKLFSMVRRHGGTVKVTY